MARPRVGKHEVGQVAHQDTGNLGMPRGTKHSGSVSHVVYSADGAFWRAAPAMTRRVTQVADLLNPAAALLHAANVFMQLSLPGVGYGVLESAVDSGNVLQHPLNCARSSR